MVDGGLIRLPLHPTKENCQLREGKILVPAGLGRYGVLVLIVTVTKGVKGAYYHCYNRSQGIVPELRS